MALAKNILAEFLKEKRIAANLSQKEVSDKLGYSTPQFISNWERGISHPPVGALKKLGVLYRIPPEELFETLLQTTIASVKFELQRKFADSRVR